jgi:anti-sigma factor RsiW
VTVKDHTALRAQLTLAAVGALDDASQMEIERHLAVCPACAAEFARWQRMGVAIRRMPKPLAPAGLVERTRALLVERQVQEAEARANFRGLALVLAFVWAMTFLAWPLERQLAAGAASLFALDSARASLWVLAYTILGSIAGTTAAVVLGLNRRQAARRAA